MNLENVVQFFLNPCVYILAVYIAVTILAFFVTDYFFGEKGTNMVACTLGLPVRGVYYVIEKAIAVLNWPWRYRNTRLLNEIFDVHTVDSYHRRENQDKVDSTLTSKANWLKSQFIRQEEARKKLGKTEKRNADSLIRFLKADFWFAHKLARKNGFRVKNTIGEYYTSR